MVASRERVISMDLNCFRSGKVHAAEMEIDIRLNEQHSLLQQQQQQNREELKQKRLSSF